MGLRAGWGLDHDDDDDDDEDEEEEEEDGDDDATYPSFIKQKITTHTIDCYHL